MDAVKIANLTQYPKTFGIAGIEHTRIGNKDDRKVQCMRRENIFIYSVEKDEGDGEMFCFHWQLNLVLISI